MSHKWETYNNEYLSETDNRTYRICSTCEAIEFKSTQWLEGGWVMSSFSPYDHFTRSAHPSCSEIMMEVVLK